MEKKTKKYVRNILMRETDKIRRHVQVKAQTLEKQVVLSEYWYDEQVNVRVQK